MKKMSNNPPKLWLLIIASVALAFLTACGEKQQTQQRSQIRPEQVTELKQTKENTRAIEEVAEVFALGGNHTDLQRDLISKELVGSVVEWDIQVYDVELIDGVYKVTSLPISVRNKNAVNMLRVVAFTYAQNEFDQETLNNIQTNGKMTVRGNVQSIVLRTAIIISPAILVHRERSAT